jgi:hypothetical protein
MTLRIRNNFRLVKKISDNNPVENYFEITKVRQLQNRTVCPSEYCSLKLTHLYSKHIEHYREFFRDNVYVNQKQHTESWSKKKRNSLKHIKGIYQSNARNLGRDSNFSFDEETIKLLTKKQTEKIDSLIKQRKLKKRTSTDMMLVSKLFFFFTSLKKTIFSIYFFFTSSSMDQYSSVGSYRLQCLNLFLTNISLIFYIMLNKGKTIYILTQRLKKKRS